MSLFAGMFSNKKLKEKVRERLPKLFAIAELESSRAGKIGMEVGSMREQILIALLVYAFGEKKVETDVPITKPEVDVMVDGNPISIKTVTGSGGIKAVWTVDPQKVREFYEGYSPSCDMLLAIIRWNVAGREKDGGLYFIPKSAQKRLLAEMGRRAYLKVPKQGTNPRGVEMSRRAIVRLLADKETMKIEIPWTKEDLKHKTYRRWLDMWAE